jgi:hypothetical protein
MSTSVIKPPAGIKWEPRTAADLATDAGRRTTEDVWCCVPWRLVCPSAYATFATFSRQEHRTETCEDAKCDPEKYDLLRARRGGLDRVLRDHVPCAADATRAPPR